MLENMIYDRTEADVMAGDTPWVPEWQQGNINTSGKDASSTTRVRSIGFYQFNGSILRIYVPEGLKVAARQYSSAAASSFERVVPYPSGWLQGGVLFDVLSNKFYRFIVNRVDNSTLTPSEPALSDITFVLLNEKGRYNYTDLNRVGAAINSVSARLYSDGYGEPVTLRTDFTPTDDVRVSELSSIVEAVRMIRECVGGFEDTPNAPESIRFLDYNRANDIEKILYDADLLLDKLENARFFAGDLYSGEV